MRYLLIAIVILEAILTSLLPYTRGWFFESLEQRTGIYLMLGYLFFNSWWLDFIQSTKSYWVTKYSLKKREQHTVPILGTIEPKEGIDNVPQRIQEDVKLMYQNRYTVYMEYWISGLILVGLIAANLQHYLLILAALGYAAISIAIAYLFNPRMRTAEKEVQRSEATFRGNLANSFLNAANIFSLKAARVKLEYTLFTKLQNAFLLIIPYLLLLPGYLSGSISFGDLIKIATMFSLIVVNADILIAMYPTLIVSKASEERVKEL